MTQPFVPFFQALASSQAKAREEFRRVDTDREDKTQSCQHPAPEGLRARVELEKEGETVVRIRVYCPCGEVIQLNCEY